MDSRGRRLFDKIVIAFDQACEQRDLRTARSLHAAMAFAAERMAPDGIERRGTSQRDAVFSRYDRFRQLETEAA